MTKTLILDTNVYLTEVSSLFAFGKNNIAIPTIILDEIDKHKSRQDTAGFNARSMNRTLDNVNGFLPNLELLCLDGDDNKSG